MNDSEGAFNGSTRFLGSLTLGWPLSIESPQHWFVAFQAIRIASAHNRQFALRAAFK